VNRWACDFAMAVKVISIPSTVSLTELQFSLHRFPSLWSTVRAMVRLRRLDLITSG
jgi:hypothetical protein